VVGQPTLSYQLLKAHSLELARLAHSVSTPLTLLHIQRVKVKVKGSIPQKGRRRGAYRPFLWPLSPYVNRPLKSVTHGQCDARPTVTFPAVESVTVLWPLVPNYSYCLVNRGTRVSTTCPGLLFDSASDESRTRDLAITSPTRYRCTTKPRSYSRSR